jgi:hypothetical protein
VGVLVDKGQRVLEVLSLCLLLLLPQMLCTFLCGMGGRAKKIGQSPVAVCCIVLQSVAVCCSMVQCVAVQCTALQSSGCMHASVPCVVYA